MSEKIESTKKVYRRLGCNVDEATFQAIENYRWPNHMTMPEFVQAAIADKLAKEKLV